MPENDTQQTTSDSDRLGDAGKAALVAERKRADDAEKALKDANARLEQAETAHQAALDQAQARISELESANSDVNTALTARELDVARLNAGIDAGLPRAFIDRLQGTDAESFKTDAAALAGLIPDTTPSPFPKADPSQGATSAGKQSTGDLFAAAVQGSL